MKGTTGAHRNIVLHAYVCRKVDPSIVRDLEEWNKAVSGGPIPTVCTDGLRVGGILENKNRAPLVEPKNMNKAQRKSFMRLKREREEEDSTEWGF